VIAALFVEKGGVYWGLVGVDAWDRDRDARLYAGPWPVVAHPPCSAWCQLAPVNQARYGHPVGDDGGCFASALDSVWRYGGVLEHPKASYAWPAFGLTTPTRQGWTRDLFYDGWVCEVSQRAYGHLARKSTWLYYCGASPPPLLDWSRPKPEATVSWMRNHGGGDLPRIGKAAAARTPIPFRDLLISIADSANAPRAVVLP
jgi:hypothetical protein